MRPSFLAAAVQLPDWTAVRVSDWTLQVLHAAAAVAAAE
jgi:hypothetical protein